MESNNTFTDLYASKNDKIGVDIDAIMQNITIMFYTITILFGITGNAMVIWMAGFKLKASVTNVWLANLAVADLIFCITRITSLIKKLFYEDWPFGVFVCKFNGFFKYTNMFCSVFILAVISLDRAICVCRPVLTRQRRTLCVARIISVGVWILAVMLSVPYYVYRHVYIAKNNLTKCSLEVRSKQKVLSFLFTEISLFTLTYPSDLIPQVPQGTEGDKRAKLALYSIRFLGGFLLPFLIILTGYVLAGLRIRQTRIVHKSRPLRILVGLVCAFFLCWGPYHCLLLAKMVDSKSQAVKVGLPLTKGIAYFNSCVNPLLYFCMGLDTRLRFKQSLSGVYAQALAEDWEGQTSQSKECTGPRTADESRVDFHEAN